MSQRQARRGAWLLTLVIMILAVWLELRLDENGATGQPAETAQPRPAGPPVAMPAQGSDLIVTMGLNEPMAVSTWKGQVGISEGKILSVEVARGKGKAKEHSFNVTGIAPKKKQITLPRVRLTVDAPETAQVELNLEQGKFAVRLDELRPGVPKLYLDGKVAVERGDGSVRLTDPETEDDYPVLARAPNGKCWLVYNEFQKGKPLIPERVHAGNFDELVATGHGDQLRMKLFDGKTWSPSLDVTGAGLDLWRPTICIDSKGVVHVAWSQRVDGNYDIYHRSFTPGPA